LFVSNGGTPLRLDQPVALVAVPILNNNDNVIRRHVYLPTTLNLHDYSIKMFSIFFQIIFRSQRRHTHKNYLHKIKGKLLTNYT